MKIELSEREIRSIINALEESCMIREILRKRSLMTPQFFIVEENTKIKDYLNEQLENE